MPGHSADCQVLLRDLYFVVLRVPNDRNHSSVRADRPAAETVCTAEEGIRLVQLPPGGHAQSLLPVILI